MVKKENVIRRVKRLFFIVCCIACVSKKTAATTKGRTMGGVEESSWASPLFSSNQIQANPVCCDRRSYLLPRTFRCLSSRNTVGGREITQTPPVRKKRYNWTRGLQRLFVAHEFLSWLLKQVGLAFKGTGYPEKRERDTDTRRKCQARRTKTTIICSRYVQSEMSWPFPPRALYPLLFYSSTSASQPD